MDKVPPLNDPDITAMILAAVLKKNGAQTLTQDHFDFDPSTEADVLLVYHDDNQHITVSLGVNGGGEDEVYEES